MMVRRLAFLVILVALSARSQTAQKQVEFEWTAAFISNDLTVNMGDGNSQQTREKLPYQKSFFSRPARFVYLSAQKARVTREDPLHPGSLQELDNGRDGSVHVVIRVNGS